MAADVQLFRAGVIALGHYHSNVLIPKLDSITPRSSLFIPEYVIFRGLYPPGSKH